jgi:hypothetical protein
VAGQFTTVNAIVCSVSLPTPSNQLCRARCASAVPEIAVHPKTKPATRAPAGDSKGTRKASVTKVRIVRKCRGSDKEDNDAQQQSIRRGLMTKERQREVDGRVCGEPVE